MLFSLVILFSPFNLKNKKEDENNVPLSTENKQMIRKKLIFAVIVILCLYKSMEDIVLKCETKFVVCWVFACITCYLIGGLKIWTGIDVASSRAVLRIRDWTWSRFSVILVTFSYFFGVSKLYRTLSHFKQLLLLVPKWEVKNDACLLISSHSFVLILKMLTRK